MKPRGADGQALIETVLLGLLFIIPLIWALTILADLHRAALAATAAVREAGFEAARSVNLQDAESVVSKSVEEAFRNHGLAASGAKVSLSAGALQRGATVEVSVSYSVPVLQAPFLGSVSGPSIEIRARHLTRVDPYRSRE